LTCLGVTAQVREDVSTVADQDGEHGYAA
jgi:hypothetical protein